MFTPLFKHIVFFVLPSLVLDFLTRAILVVRAAPLPAGGSYEVYASYYEIYNEQVFDLLEDIPEDLPSDQVYRRKVNNQSITLSVRSL